MALDQNINNELKNAMLAKDGVKIQTIKAIKAAFTVAKTEKGATGILTDEQEIKILQKLFNQRKESFEIFTKSNRPDLAILEKNEMDVIATYLPAQLSDEELTDYIKAVIQNESATSIRDMGKVIGMASKGLAGRAEGARISAIVKQLLVG